MIHYTDIRAWLVSDAATLNVWISGIRPWPIQIALEECLKYLFHIKSQLDFLVYSFQPDMRMPYVTKVS